MRIDDTPVKEVDPSTERGKRALNLIGKIVHDIHDQALDVANNKGVRSPAERRDIADKSVGLNLIHFALTYPQLAEDLMNAAGVEIGEIEMDQWVRVIEEALKR